MTDTGRSVPVTSIHVTRRTLQQSIEHHILVLLIGAAIGSYFTVQMTNVQSTKTTAAVHDALSAASTPVAVAPSKH